jgi:hypothetical protein
VRSERLAARRCRLKERSRGLRAARSMGRRWHSNALSIRYALSRASPGREDDQRCRWSVVVWWACQDLNLGPHPYQLNAGNRCAQGPFRSSRSTVRGEVMCSHRVQLCALIRRPIARLSSNSFALCV